jgi:glycosyltransferase involved in cell wall biosynthesis
MRVTVVSAGDIASPRDGKALYSRDVARCVRAKRDRCGRRLELRLSRGRRLVLRAILGMTICPGMWARTLSLFNLAQLIRQMLLWRPDVVVIDHFNVSWAFVVARLCGHSGIVLATHNVESDARRSYLDNVGRLERVAGRYEAWVCSRWEHMMVRRVKATVCLSRTDAGKLSLRRAAPVVTIFPSYEASESERQRFQKASRVVDGCGQGASIVWVGSFGYRAKQLNAEWFLADIWPWIRASVSGARLQICGSCIGRELLRIASDTPGVDVVDGLESLNEVYASADLAVVPERFGGGFKLKLLEAAVWGVPIVASPEAVFGTEFGRGEGCIVATTAGEWAQACALLCSLDELGELRCHVTQAARDILDRSHRFEQFECAWTRVLSLAGSPGQVS